MAGGVCAQPPPLSTCITKVKHSSTSERRKPYRPALATCSATMRDGLCFAWHSSLQLTPGDKCKTAPGVVVIVPWFILSKSLWIFSFYWLEKEWEGGAACCPCQLMSALPAKNVEQGEKYALWSQGPLIDKTGSHWFWVFAFFLCSSNREHWNSLLKLQGFHTSKSGLSLCVSVINWIENAN